MVSPLSNRESVRLGAGQSNRLANPRICENTKWFFGGNKEHEERVLIEYISDSYQEKKPDVDALSLIACMLNKCPRCFSGPIEA